MYRQPNRRGLYLAGSPRLSKPRYADSVSGSIVRAYSELLDGLTECSIARAIAEGENLHGRFTSIEDARFETLRKLERNFREEEMRYMMKSRKYTTHRGLFERWTAKSQSTAAPARETGYDIDAVERKRHELAVFFAERRAASLEGRIDITTALANEVRAMNTKKPEQIIKMHRKYLEIPADTFLKPGYFF